MLDKHVEEKESSVLSLLIVIILSKTLAAESVFALSLIFLCILAALLSRNSFTRDNTEIYDIFVSCLNTFYTCCAEDSVDGVSMLNTSRNRAIIRF